MYGICLLLGISVDLLTPIQSKSARKKIKISPLPSPNITGLMKTLIYTRIRAKRINLFYVKQVLILVTLRCQGEVNFQ